MDLSNFAERLSELMFYRGIDAAKLSTELACGDCTIYHYLSGRYLPTVAMTVKLADYFECTTDYLLGLTEKSDTKLFKPCPPFEERLENLCKTLGTTRYRLQKKTNISESTMRYWIRGKTAPSIVNVVKIAEALECTVDFVLGRE